MARKITAGETLTFAVSAQPTATVTVRFAGPERHSHALTHEGGGNFRKAVSTSNWKVGTYTFEIEESVEGCVVVVRRGAYEIAPSLTSIAPGSDMRSNAAKAVEHIEAMLSGSATLEARKYKINNRELERHSIAELMTLLSFWRRELAREDAKAAGRSTLGPRIEVRI